MGPGVRRDDAVGGQCPLRSPTRLAALGTLPRKRERVRDYTDAVVTPPSTTMVCPVMKLDASEPR
jgi:hypothetical protein